MKWIHNKSEVPKEPHFAIIEFSQYYVEGDERSRTNPGHGYPGHSESKCEYIVFDNELEWKADIDKRMTSPYGNKDNFVAIRATPATIGLHTSVNIK
jgi:hypothetical protein